MYVVLDQVSIFYIYFIPFQKKLPFYMATIKPYYVTVDFVLKWHGGLYILIIKPAVNNETFIQNTSEIFQSPFYPLTNYHAP